MVYDALWDVFFFFFKQNTAYEMRISDWSSDVCSSDLHMLMASTVAGLSALVGILVGGHTWLFVLAAALAGLFGGLLVALGPVVARVGMTSMIVLVVTADLQVPIVHAPAVATLIFAGGVLQMLMAVAAWPLQRYRPERFALATVMQQLAEGARSRPDASQP